MVSWEFEKPSEWSIGKKIGFIGIIFLIIGPFLPYLVLEDALGRVEIVIFLNYEWNRLWMFLPHLSAILFIFLLFVKFEIYLEKDQERYNIKPIIVMIWGSWLFLTYLVDAYRLGNLTGSGFWIIIIGSFLCGIAGYMEWRNPSVRGPQILFGRNKIIGTSIESKTNPLPKTVTSVEPKKLMSTTSTTGNEKAIIRSGGSRQFEDMTPTAVKGDMVIDRELKTEEEKTLSRWLRHIQKDGRTYERCLKCGNYVFIAVEDKGKTITFKCPDCEAMFNLKK
ncbi:MAG: hypothetical protein JSV09_05920 [Thermoplasmata archaeon]|nr:MAG: hypothetical protein JSV09_05920 [Thermoplasmata archaeon]